MRSNQQASVRKAQVKSHKSRRGADVPYTHGPIDVNQKGSQGQKSYKKTKHRNAKHSSSQRKQYSAPEVDVDAPDSEVENLKTAAAPASSIRTSKSSKPTVKAYNVDEAQEVRCVNAMRLTVLTARCSPRPTIARMRYHRAAALNVRPATAMGAPVKMASLVAATRLKAAFWAKTTLMKIYREWKRTRPALGRCSLARCVRHRDAGGLSVSNVILRVSHVLPAFPPSRFSFARAHSLSQ